MIRRTRRVAMVLILGVCAGCTDCDDFETIVCTLTPITWEDSNAPILETQFARVGDDVLGTTVRESGNLRFLQAYQHSWTGALGGSLPRRFNLETDELGSITRPAKNAFTGEWTFGGTFRQRLTAWRWNNNQFWIRQILDQSRLFNDVSWGASASAAVATGLGGDGILNFYCQTGATQWNHCGSWSPPQPDSIGNTALGAHRHQTALSSGGTSFLYWERTGPNVSWPSIAQFNTAREFVCSRAVDTLPLAQLDDRFTSTDLRIGRMQKTLAYGYWNRGPANRNPITGVIALDPCVAAGNCGSNQCALTDDFDTTAGPVFNAEQSLSGPSIQLVAGLRSEAAASVGLVDTEEDREGYGAFYPGQLGISWGVSAWERQWKGTAPFESGIGRSRPVFAVDCLGADCIGLFGDEMNYLTALRGDFSQEGSSSEVNLPQLLSGGGVATSLAFNNLDRLMEAEITVTIRAQDGTLVPFSIDAGVIDFEGVDFVGTFTETIPAGGKLSLSSPASGDFRISTVQATSAKRISGVATFTGPFLASGQGAQRASAFSTPVRREASAGLNTGVAVQNLGDSLSTVTYMLCDADGKKLATAVEVLLGRGQQQQFIHEFSWVPEDGVILDLDSFDGTLKASSTGNMAATALEGRGNQFTTVPVEVTAGPTF